MPDYSRFYHVTNAAFTETMLISASILRLPSLLYYYNETTTFFNENFVPDYSTSGHKLCFASNETSGLVTHLFIIVSITSQIKLAIMDMDDLFLLLLALLSYV